jgi:hypothetical protein
VSEQFGTPPKEYSQADESQFRAAVRRALRDIEDPRQADPTLVTSVTLGAGNNNNYALGADVVTLRVTPNAGGSTLTGILAGTETRKLRIINLGSATLTITHQDTNSTAANRIVTPDAASWVISATGVVDLEYDDVTDRWRLVERVPSTTLGRIYGLTLTVDDDGTDDVYAVTWAVSSEVTNSYDLRLTFLRNGLYVDEITEGTPATTSSSGVTDGGAGDGVVDTHMVVANLIGPGGGIVDTKVVVARSTI